MTNHQRWGNFFSDEHISKDHWRFYAGVFLDFLEIVSLVDWNDTVDHDLMMIGGGEL